MRILGARQKPNKPLAVDARCLLRAIDAVAARKSLKQAWIFSASHTITPPGSCIHRKAINSNKPSLSSGVLPLTLLNLGCTRHSSSELGSALICTRFQAAELCEPITWHTSFVGVPGYSWYCPPGSRALCTASCPVRMGFRGLPHAR